MTNREKVIEGLEKCRRCECDDCTEKGASKAPWDCPVYDDFVDSALALLKEQEAKQPIHIHEEFQEHDWYRNKDDKIDEFAFDVDYHNGPSCKRCYYSFCIHCDLNGWNKKPCVIDEYKCLRCEKYISKGTKFCSNCGQEVEWDV